MMYHIERGVPVFCRNIHCRYKHHYDTKRDAYDALEFIMMREPLPASIHEWVGAPDKSYDEP